VDEEITRKLLGDEGFAMYRQMVDTPRLVDPSPLQARIKELEAALKAVEWAVRANMTDEEIYLCPCCYFEEAKGHSSFCAVGRALGGAAERSRKKRREEG